MAEVKKVSGMSEDGEAFVNKAVAGGGQMAVAQIRRVVTSISSQEQCAAVHLFKGIEGLCNSMANGNRLLDDPVSAYEYLALASLIMRMLRTAPIEKEV